MKKLGLFVLMSSMLVLFFAPVNVMARNEQHRSSVRQRPDPGSYNAQSTQSIPEPSSLLLLASSGGLLYCLRRYLKK